MKKVADVYSLTHLLSTTKGKVRATFGVFCLLFHGAALRDESVPVIRQRTSNSEHRMTFAVVYENELFRFAVL